MGPNFKLSFPSNDDHTVAWLIEKCNAVLQDYAAWVSQRSNRCSFRTGIHFTPLTTNSEPMIPSSQEQKDVQVAHMSSKWALDDHLEYCSDDKLSELDNYDEHKEAGKVSIHHPPASLFRS